MRQRPAAYPARGAPLWARFGADVRPPPGPEPLGTVPGALGVGQDHRLVRVALRRVGQCHRVALPPLLALGGVERSTPGRARRSAGAPLLKGSAGYYGHRLTKLLRRLVESRLYADGTYSSGGCGICPYLGLTAGPFDVGPGIVVRVTRSAFPGANAALGAATYAFELQTSVAYRTCTTPDATTSCQPDFAYAPLHGGSFYPHPAQGVPVPPDNVGNYITFSVSLGDEVTFTAFDASDRVVTTDTFAPSLFVAPEPSTIALTLGGLGMLGAVTLRRRA
ncbi:hypothetical protein tb265_29370 [Gemmatimonadetes bacterium T265]|nr:hypothetical protein tb265_29370 [Gemmatimonadetes bacterium T265]